MDDTKQLPTVHPFTLGDTPPETGTYLVLSENGPGRVPDVAWFEGEDWWIGGLRIGKVVAYAKIDMEGSPPAPDGRAEGLREAAEIVTKKCQKCGGEGWLWGHELSDPPDVIGHDDTRYSCDGEPHKLADAILARAAELEKTDE